MNVFRRYRGKFVKKARRALPLSALTAYLLVAALISTSLTFASYVTSASGAAEARVARWDVQLIEGNSVGIDRDTPAVDGVVTGKYEFQVVNNSEVAVSYTVVFTTDKPLPAGLELSMGDQTFSTNASQTQFEFSGGALGAGETVDLTLNIAATLSELLDNVNQNIDLSVTAVQID